MATDPILWLDADLAQSETSPHAARRAIIHKGDGEYGADLVERHPQFCSQGDDAQTVRRNYARFAHVVRTDGNLVRVPLTNAAAHTDTNTAYAGNQRAKFRALGWFNAGRCPLADVHSGMLQPARIMDAEVRALALAGAPPCRGPVERGVCQCPHSVAEIAERRKRHAKRMVEIAKNSPETKAEESAQLQRDMAASVKELAASAAASAAAAANSSSASVNADTIAAAVAAAVSEAMARAMGKGGGK